MGNEGDRYDRYDRQIEKRIDGLEADVESLKTWRAWIIGIVAGIGLMTGAFAKQVAGIFSHMLGGG